MIHAAPKPAGQPTAWEIALSTLALFVGAGLLGLTIYALCT